MGLKPEDVLAIANQYTDEAISGGNRKYLGDITPRVSNSSPNITSSSYSTSYGTFYDWYAFNGVTPASYRDPQGNCWQGDGANQWIQYQFNEPRYFTKLELKCFSNYSGDWVGSIKVEGSHDGTTFKNVLSNGATMQEITAELAPISEGGSGQESDITILLDDTETWSYIRVTFVEAMSISYSPSCYLDEMYVYGGKNDSGSGTTIEVLYEADSTSQVATIELTKPYSNYDFIVIQGFYRDNANRYAQSAVYFKDTLDDILDDDGYFGIANNVGYLGYTFVDADSLSKYGSSGAGFYISKILGIKF